MLFLWGGAGGLGGGRRPVGGARQSRPTLHVPHPQQGQGVRVPGSPNLNTPRFSAGWYTAYILHMYITKLKILLTICCNLIDKLKKKDI